MLPDRSDHIYKGLFVRQEKQEKEKEKTSSKNKSWATESAVTQLLTDLVVEAFANFLSHLNI